MSLPDIRKSRKWLSMEEAWLLIFLLIFLLGMLALNIYLARILPGGEWLYLRWSGARVFLFEQVEPYGAAVAQRVQDLVYGRNATASEYGYVLNDPFYIVLLYTPLAVLPEFISLFTPSLAPSLNFALSRGVWMLLAEAALLGTVFFALSLLEWQPPPWIYVSIVGFALFSFFSLQSLVSASPTIFLTFLYLAILLALRTYNDELAGALLFFVAYQWEVSALFFLYIIILVFANKRWNVLTGFVMSLVVALVISFLIYPGWGLPYIRAVLSDWIRGASLNLNSIAKVWFPDSRVSIGMIVSGVLGLIILLEWIGSTQSNFRRIVWTASLSLAATPLMGFAIFPSNYVVLLLPLIVILMPVWERWTRYRVLACFLVLVAAFLIPFGIHFRRMILEDRLYSDLLRVLPPIVTIMGLYWMRWWVIRSPRTWMDQIGERR